MMTAAKIVMVLAVGCCHGARVRTTFTSSTTSAAPSMLDTDLGVSDADSIHTVDFRSRNAFKVTCPVLGALYKKGVLTPDNTGRITKTNLQNSLQWMGNTWQGAMFQGMGIAAYAEDDRYQTKRTRSLHERWLNIFFMNPGELTSSFFVQHGVSTNIRDARFDSDDSLDATKQLPAIDGAQHLDAVDARQLQQHLDDADAAEAARVRATREKRLQYWFEEMEGVLEDNKLYANGLGKLIATLKTNGDHSGEWSKEYQSTFHEGAASTDDVSEAQTEWQPTLAFTAFMAMAGRRDQEEGPVYVTLDDLKGFYLDSDFPDDWSEQNRHFGFLPIDLDLAEELHEQNPSLVFSRLIKEHVNPGGSFAHGANMLTVWMSRLFQMIGATDQFGTISEMLFDE